MDSTRYARVPELATEDGPSPNSKKKANDGKEKTWQEIEDAAAPILDELDAMAGRAVQRRKATEQRWLKDLRQFHGIYDSSVQNVLTDDDSRSQVFINITRPKTNAWSARLGDMLFPNDEKNYGIDPTPVPELTTHARQAVADAEQLDQQAMEAIDQHNAQLEQGGAPDPALAQQAGEAGAMAKRLRDEYTTTQKELEEARQRARAMEREIDDKLTEARYPAVSRAIIEDAAKLGSGIIKGPIVSDAPQPKWLKRPRKDDADDNGADVYELVPRSESAQTYRRTNPWHFFPDPDAETIADAEFVLERHIPTKAGLRKLANRMQFERDVVKDMLKEGPQHGQTGGSSGLDFLAVLHGLENGGEGSSESINTARDRYVIWEFYGQLEIEQIAAMLRLLGRGKDADRFEEENDEVDTQMVRIFFAGKRLLKIEEHYLLDSQDFPYSVFAFEKSEASILGGVGVPHLMRNEQAMLNSAVRMMMDNAGLAVGPQIVIDKEVVQPENGSWKMTPRKIWSWLSGKGTQKAAPFTAIDIPMNQEHLSNIIQLALRFVDEAVAMPLLAQGEQGAHITKTMGGMSMLFNSANVVFRRVVKNWDDEITVPTIRRAYDFEMQFSDKEEIKGDMQIEARGTSVLLVREMQAEQLLLIIERFSTHPVVGIAVKAYEAMRLVLQAMNINPHDVLLEKEEYLEKLGQMTEESGEGEGNPAEQMRQQTALQVAQMDKDTRMQVAQSAERVAHMRMQGEMMKLAQDRDLSIEKIAAMFKVKELDAFAKLETQDKKNASDERKLAAEIGIEMQNAREARAQGLQPTGSGGSISMGRIEQ